MLSVSTTFKELIKSYEREFTFVISLNGTVLVDAQISEIDIDEAGFSANALNIGEFCRNEISIKAGATSGVSWVRGDNVFVQVHLTGTEDLIPLGLFYITEIKRENEYSLRITGYDVPPWYSQDFDQESTSVQQNIAYMEARGGMLLTNKNLLTTSSVTIPEDTKMSNMDYMRYIAGLDGYNIRSNRQGGLELYKVIDIPHLVPTAVLTPSETLVPFASLRDPEEPIYVGQIARDNILESGLTVNDNITSITSFTIHGADNYEYVTGTGYGIENDNPFVTESTNKSIMIDYLNLEYYAATVNYRGDPSLQIGDIVTVPHEDTEVPIIIMRQRFHIDGGLSSTIESYTSEEQGDIVPVSPTGKRLDAQDLAISVAKQVAQTAKEDVQELDSNLNQQGVFDRLTNNGESQGIFIENGQIYVNMSYLATGQIKLGGTNNDNGEMAIYDSDNSLRGILNNDGYSTTSVGYLEFFGDTFDDDTVYYEQRSSTSGDTTTYWYVVTTDTAPSSSKTYYTKVISSQLDITAGLMKFYRQVDTVTDAEYEAADENDEELDPVYELKQTGFMIFNQIGASKEVVGTPDVGVNIGTEGGFQFTYLRDGTVEKYPEGGPFNASDYDSMSTLPELAGLWVGANGAGIGRTVTIFPLLTYQYPVSINGLLDYYFMEYDTWEDTANTWAEGGTNAINVYFRRYGQTGEAFPAAPKVIYSVGGTGGYFVGNIVSYNTTHFRMWVYCVKLTSSGGHPIINYLAFLSTN